jgi:hypothetical protein
MWVDLPIEIKTRDALNLKYGTSSKGEDIYSLYTTARHSIVQDILPEIKRICPELTDHGPDHVADVLNNADQLIEGYDLSAIELYSLLMTILFHDVGNFYGRANHQNNTGRIYDYVRSSPDHKKNEKFFITEAVKAHCGFAADGTRDTLKCLSRHPYERENIRLQEIAAILRFADELAEGPQRTSLFMAEEKGYSDASKIFHKYARITTLLIDKSSERIALTYDVEIENPTQLHEGSQAEQELCKFLEFIYCRIVKLDQERKYTKHYCSALSCFKSTSALIRFWLKGTSYDLGLEQIVLTDLLIPGDTETKIPTRFPDYNTKNIVNAIYKIL